MTMTRGGQTATPQPPGAIAPASWPEWRNSIYNPDKFVLLSRGFSGTSALAIGGTDNPRVEITAPGFAYALTVDFWRHDTGAAPPFPIRLEILEGTELSWTGGSISGRLFGGPGGQGGGLRPLYFPEPREIAKGTQLLFNLSNALNNAAGGNVAVDVDFTVWVMVLLKRTSPVVRE